VGLIAVSIVVGCGCAAAEKGDADSPRVAFVEYQRAEKKKDWNSVFERLSPGSQNQLLHVLSSFGTLGDKQGKMAKIVEKDTDLKKLDTVYKSRRFDKLTRMEQDRLVASCFTERKKLFIELNQRLDELRTDRPTLIALRKVVISGRAAKGQATQTTFDEWRESTKTGGRKDVKHREKRQQDVPVYFIKQDAKWLIATEEEWKSVTKPKK
jgi:hypothetical protein